MLELNDMLSPLSKCKCLILDTCVKKCDLPGIAGLLQVSPYLETLIINMNFLYGSKVLSVLDSKGMLSPLSNCRCLILDTYMEEHDIPGIAGLLQSSPNLETLIINMTDFYEMTSLFDPEVDCALTAIATVSS
ncbi:hypothetical protein L1049_009771 [Liquidambar formosana]|uniref:Uncharacterized protein n=1 Tax=Liquidambar formosana TaxID=63359 RepID=A0AAP0N6C1_LIQFO